MYVYESEIVNARADMSAIPAFANLSEMSFYVLEANEKDFSDMMESIGLNELAVFESTGNILLYEDGSKEKNSAMESIKSFVEKAWARVKAIFERIMRAVRELYTKMYISIHQKKINDVKVLKAGVNDLPDSYSVSTFKYTELDAFKSQSGKIYTALQKMRKVEWEDEMELRDTTGEDIVNKLGVGDLNGENLRKLIRGDETKITKDTVRSNIDNYITATKDFGAVDTQLKRMFKDAKSNFDEKLKAVKKDTPKDKNAINGLRAAVQATTLIYSVTLSEFYAQVRTIVKVIVDVYKAGHKSEKNNKSGDNAFSGATKESAVDYEIASMFAW